MHTPRSSVSRIIRRLEQAGYLHRRESPTDRRSFTVEVDRSRLSAVTSQYRQQAARLSDVLSTFTHDEATTIVKFLESLTNDGTGSDESHVS